MNFDPYEFLGVSANASDQAVKNAFRSLTDRYRKEMRLGAGGRLAQQKLLDTLHAYDIIKKMRADASASSNRRAESRRLTIESFTSAYGKLRKRDAGDSGEISPEFRSVAGFIDSGNCHDALEVLNRLEPRFRTAEWYYLRALAHSGLGNLPTAFEDAKTACGLVPNEMRYRRLSQTIEEQIRERKLRKERERNEVLSAQPESLMGRIFRPRLAGVGKIA